MKGLRLGRTPGGGGNVWLSLFGIQLKGIMAKVLLTATGPAKIAVDSEN